VGMENRALDDLVKSGTIIKYEFDNYDCDGNINKISDNRNTQKLILYFPDGNQLAITTTTFGCSDDTILIIGE
jgi:hypothetical protein